MRGLAELRTLRHRRRGCDPGPDHTEHRGKARAELSPRTVSAWNSTEIPPRRTVWSVPGTYGRFNYGTYSRDLFAIRPSIGDRETWEVGFSWLSSGDDKNSIHYGIAPKENIVIGTDFMATHRQQPDRDQRSGRRQCVQHGHLEGQLHATPTSTPIYASGAEGIKKVRDILVPYITVNDNFRPLNVEKLPTVAYELGSRSELLRQQSEVHVSLSRQRLHVLRPVVPADRHQGLLRSSTAPA